MQIDSTPLDVRVVLGDGQVNRVEMTGLVDLATRSMAALVAAPTTKSVDAALLLARALTPEPMRPSWSNALRMSRSVLPHRSLTSVDQRLADAAARPVLAPETIVFVHGKAYLSQDSRSAARALGISLQPTHPDTPTDKAGGRTYPHCCDRIPVLYATVPPAATPRMLAAEFVRPVHRPPVTTART